jgi:hypothetical protein
VYFPYREYDHPRPTDGAFSGSGAFRVLPPIPAGLLVEQLRHVVLDYLLEDEPITEAFAAQEPGSEVPRRLNLFIVIKRSKEWRLAMHMNFNVRTGRIRDIHQVYPVSPRTG